MRRPHLISRAVFVATLLLSVLAHAETPPTAPAVVPPKELTPASVSYGWQTAAADGASAVLLTMGLMSSSTKLLSQTGPAVLALSGVGGYLLAAPIVHVAHGKVLIGSADFALRVATPFLTTLVSTALGPPCTMIEGDYSDHKCEPFIYGGLFVGALTASIIDAALLAREAPRPLQTAGLDFTVAPMISRDRSGLSVVGSF